MYSLTKQSFVFLGSIFRGRLGTFLVVI